MLHKTIPHTQVYYQLNLYFLPLKYTDLVVCGILTAARYKRILMDPHSFSEHKRKGPNRVENKVLQEPWHCCAWVQIQGQHCMQYWCYPGSIDGTGPPWTWHLHGMLRISQRRSHCGIRFHSSIRACSRSWRVCGGTGCHSRPWSHEAAIKKVRWWH